MKNFKIYLAKLPTRYPKTHLAIGLFLILMLSPFLFQIEFDFGAKVWFRQSDPYIVSLNEFEKNFGNDESLVVALQTESNIFNPKTLQLLNDVTEKMWEIPSVIRVESLTNYHWTQAEGDDIMTEPFIPLDTLDDREILLSREKQARDHDVISRMYVSKDFKSAIVYGRLAYVPGEETDFNKVYEGALKALKEFENNEGVKIHLLGQPSVSHHFQALSFGDIQQMVPILLLLILFYLLFCFRSFNGIFIPFCIIGASLSFTGGLIGLLGLKVNTLTFILPSVLIAISIADSVHILASFYKNRTEGMELEEACTMSLVKNIWPITLTSLSTAIGFFSLMNSEIVPVKDVGLLAGIGTICALFFSYFYAVPILYLTKDSARESVLDKNLLSKDKIARYLRFIYKIRYLVIGLSYLITCGAFYLALQNEVNSNPYDYFRDDDPITHSNQFVLSNFGGSGGPELIFDSSSLEGVKEPEFLKKIEAFQQWVESENYVNKAVSVVDILKEVNQSLNGGEEAHYKISDQKDVIAQELFLYTMSLPQGMDINNRIDLKNRLLRMSLIWDLQSSKESLEKVEVIEKKAKEMDMKMEVTGKPVLFHRMNSYVVDTFFKSMGMALLFITVLLMIIFRSFSTGLLSLIPNFVPIIIGGGLLTILNKPIDVGCALVASVTLGIAVDDTIHFLSHYKDLKSRGMDCFSALVNVFYTTGFALIVTTVILVSGFGIFMFAHLVPNINFGILCALVLTIALVCDLVVLPALILAFTKEKDKISAP
ncbi:MMPL family transporter [Halobacteriovorax sp. GB3]|uniref:efflux RND transporter permease subunit n=1 Tax=Halobacteriovorax sp. GB3 TaxID=2719615 RepID=UPI00235E1A56|nr:MMPL family transporter [Halobacteriovorax sp. GB3]MDD0853446.1 MMPL family transporter [Halobacteriovorax sp. GB3]